jgi:succinate dehydrogenase flavin-adding protein (antitoxin of CptAB toxin-antitoxin module)
MLMDLADNDLLDLLLRASEPEGDWTHRSAASMLRKLAGVPAPGATRYRP